MIHGKQTIFLLLIVLGIMLVPHSGFANTDDFGFFRTIPSETPERGVLRVSNTSFHSSIVVNRILTERYGVRNPSIFSSVTEAELGITNSFSLNGSLPYYADLFTQGGRDGKKTGAGDVVLGLRFSRRLEDVGFKGFSIGGRVRIPEELGYGPEPLGFRTFSYGEMAYSIDASVGFKFKMVDWNVSASMIRFPKTARSDTIYANDLFYDTGFGYMGIGSADATGLTSGIFPNQVNVSFGTSVSFKPWLAGIIELNSTIFTDSIYGSLSGTTASKDNTGLRTENARKSARAQAVSAVKSPKGHRENIVTFTPAVRIGKPGGFNCSIGMDHALSGEIPERTFIFRFRIPTLSAHEIKKILIKRRIGDEVRARKSLIAVPSFSTSDITYLYENELRNSLEKNVGYQGFMEVVPEKRVDTVFKQQELVPLKDKPQQLGVRLGANYLINTDIIRYDIDRSPDFSIPFLISFPQSKFTLSARASVTNLATGETHPLGVVSASVVKSRGVTLFPSGPSSDITDISEPEKRVAEKELIDRWIDSFNRVIMDNIKLFGWTPEKEEAKGDVGQGG